MQGIADRREFAEVMKATLAIYGKDASKAVLDLYWNALLPYDIDTVRQAFSNWLTDPDQGRFSPKPADIIRNIQTIAGKPDWLSANEAWALALPAQDEANTVVWTNEIAQAWNIALPIMQEGDKVGARMAFIAAYERLTKAAQGTGRSPEWSVSEGWDKETVKRSVEQAVTTGLLPKPKVEKYQLLLSDKGKLGNGVPTKIRHFLDELKDKIKQDQEEMARRWRDESIRLQESLGSKHQEPLQQAADHGLQNNKITED
ncbi:hypothetical protein AXW38_07270 [Yersinia ruckeri]|uniref:hypothetical protein n=2 Tax=Yersiniaceae TaxID=1903411 RepID=UPI0004E38A96|nr:hypothetical protein [Yersinia ruckeri]ARZ00782.1 hypothetical protein QMA0440_01442 [Yersinia ruckeri]EKN4181128.1 hypothetical protein [Yersinia ruckeri]EKN4699252.1 hypothetical protein [Yersinia ruckeri]KFE38728.1 hypothetical protein nADLYRO1b_1993 [Yersinia ruckeri]MCK8553817.1 hypothetical protein [Yersinia ruckeri]